MGNELVTVVDIERMANAVAKSGLFGVKNAEQAMALMLIAQAEGLHPAIAARDYHIINGKPSLKADAMLARFQGAGGKVQWKEYTDTKCSATISHPQGGSVDIEWTVEMAKKAGLTSNAIWQKYPRQMLRARVISEGIRTVYPGVAVEIYTPEEVQDMVDVTPEPIAKSHFKNASLRNAFVSRVISDFESAATLDELKEWQLTHSAIIEQMKASGNDHDEQAVNELRQRYDIIKKRFTRKDDVAASYGQDFADVPMGDYEKIVEGPIPEVVPSFIGKSTK